MTEPDDAWPPGGLDYWGALNSFTHPGLWEAWRTLQFEDPWPSSYPAQAEDCLAELRALAWDLLCDDLAERLLSGEIIAAGVPDDPKSMLSRVEIDRDTACSLRASFLRIRRGRRLVDHSRRKFQLRAFGEIWKDVLFFRSAAVFTYRFRFEPVGPLKKQGTQGDQAVPLRAALIAHMSEDEASIAKAGLANFLQDASLPDDAPAAAMAKPRTLWAYLFDGLSRDYGRIPGSMFLPAWFEHIELVDRSRFGGQPEARYDQFIAIWKRAYTRLVDDVAAGRFEVWGLQDKPRAELDLRHLGVGLLRRLRFAANDDSLSDASGRLIVDIEVRSAQPDERETPGGADGAGPDEGDEKMPLYNIIKIAMADQGVKLKHFDKHGSVIKFARQLNAVEARHVKLESIIRTDVAPSLYPFIS